MSPCSHFDDSTNLFDNRKALVEKHLERTMRVFFLRVEGQVVEACRFDAGPDLQEELVRSDHVIPKVVQFSGRIFPIVAQLPNMGARSCRHVDHADSRCDEFHFVRFLLR